MYLFDSLIICSNISRAFVIGDFKTRLLVEVSNSRYFYENQFQFVICALL